MLLFLFHIQGFYLSPQFFSQRYSTDLLLTLGKYQYNSLQSFSDQSIDHLSHNILDHLYHNAKIEAKIEAYAKIEAKLNMFRVAYSPEFRYVSTSLPHLLTFP